MQKLRLKTPDIEKSTEKKSKFEHLQYFLSEICSVYRKIVAFCSA